ncbi:hypothetical protein D3C80_1349320 [compost metagenome]
MLVVAAFAVPRLLAAQAQPGGPGSRACGAVQQPLAIESGAGGGVAHRADPFIADLLVEQLVIPVEVVTADGHVDPTAGEVQRPAGSHQV